MRRPLSRNVALALALVLHCSIATAQPPPPQSDRASELFQNGRALQAQRKWPEALETYRAAWELRRSYDIAANLGEVELELGLPRDAAEHLRFALENLPSSLGDALKPARERLEKALNDARARIGELTIQTQPPGASISVDRISVGNSPVRIPLFLDPGSHLVEGRLEGHQPGREVVNVTAGGRYDLSLTLMPIGQAPAPGVAPAPAAAAAPLDASPEPRTRDRGGLRIWPIAVGGAVTAIALGAGIGFTVAANDEESDGDALSEEMARRSGRKVSSVCAPPDPVDPAQCDAVRVASDDEQRFRTFATAGFIGAGVAGLATLAYVLFWPQNAERIQAGRARLPVSVSTNGGSASVIARGMF